MVRREILYSRSGRMRELLQGKEKEEPVPAAEKEPETAVRVERRQRAGRKIALRPLTSRLGAR